jgi:hypothetical protein
MSELQDQANETSLEILQLTMERLYLQGRLDEAAKIALQMLAYAHPRIRSIKASQRHPAPTPDEERSTFDLRRLSDAELEWFATTYALLPEPEPVPEPEPERSAEPAGVLRPLNVVQQAIRQHRLAGRLQQAAALAVKVAPYEHPRIQSITDDERAAEANGRAAEASEREYERHRNRLGHLTADQLEGMARLTEKTWGQSIEE